MAIFNSKLLTEPEGNYGISATYSQRDEPPAILDLTGLSIPRKEVVFLEDWDDDHEAPFSTSSKLYLYIIYIYLY